MTLLWVMYIPSAISDALPKGVAGANPPVLVSEFAKEVEAVVVTALKQQRSLRLPQIPTDGVSEIPVDAKGRDDLELRLELVTMVDIHPSTLKELGDVMRRAVLELLKTPRYINGNYEGVKISAEVLHVRGVTVD